MAGKSCGAPPLTASKEDSFGATKGGEESLSEDIVSQTEDREDPPFDADLSFNRADHLSADGTTSPLSQISRLLKEQRTILKKKTLPFRFVDVRRRQLTRLSSLKIKKIPKR